MADELGGDQVQPSGVVDLEEGRGGAVPPPEPRLEPYDPARDRENVRGTIAKWLVLLLAGIVLLSFVILVLVPSRGSALREVLTVVYGPVAALVGAATGYYFGSKSTD